jgi:hypothetical protein
MLKKSPKKPGKRFSLKSESGSLWFEGLDGFAFVEGGFVHLGCDGVACQEFGVSIVRLSTVSVWRPHI